MSHIDIFGCILILIKTFILKKTSKSKQTKNLGFLRLCVRWAERDINFRNKNYVSQHKVCHVSLLHKWITPLAEVLFSDNLIYFIMNLPDWISIK